MDVAGDQAKRIRGGGDVDDDDLGGIEASVAARAAASESRA